MKKIFLITLSVGTLLCFAACNEFLDVYPDDKLLYEQIIKSEPLINNVLNGIYRNMAMGSLYGGDLSITTIECLAQQYSVAASDYTFYNHAQYKYNENNVKNTFSGIWSQMYKQVLAVNDFIGIVNNATVTIPANRKNLLLGEAHALRAFLHFDILRLFGPVYNSADSSANAIPYNNIGNGVSTPLLPANEVMTYILADLQTAETLLQNDPIKTDGIVKKRSFDPIADFLINRHYRMNYYAVKALQARVYLWRGDKPSALAAAKAVTDAPLVQSGKLFGWVKETSIITDNPDVIFSEEIIFGIHNRDMYTRYDSYFSGSAAPGNFLCPRTDRLKAIFDSETDWRFNAVWKVPTGKSEVALAKYAKPSNLSDSSFAYFQPMIRKAELYFIIAECEPDPTVGTDSLMAVRRHRGLQDPSITLSTNNLGLEYQKEMYGEGQLFFFYKRHNIPQIPDGSAAAPSMITMNGKYRLPLPLSEEEGQVVK